jgi:hypothetical protein
MPHRSFSWVQSIIFAQLYWRSAGTRRCRSGPTLAQRKIAGTEPFGRAKRSLLNPSKTLLRIVSWIAATIFYEKYTTAGRRMKARPA